MTEATKRLERPGISRRDFGKVVLAGLGTLALEATGVGIVLNRGSKNSPWQESSERYPREEALYGSEGVRLIDDIERKINVVAKKHGTKIYIPSGAIIGIDGILAVKGLLDEVEIETRKPPRGFGRTDKKETVLFQGPARKGVPLYPQNVNVAATLSLAGIGFDRTRLRIVSDPKAKSNQHIIKAKGSFGEFFIQVRALPSKNPKTSSLAAMSAFAKVKEIQDSRQ